MNFIDVASVRQKTSSQLNGTWNQSDPFANVTSDNWDTEKTTASLDDFLERIPDAEKVEIPLDLPDQISQIDISSSLVRPPALAMLPPAAYKGGDYSAAELFSSQVSLDAALSANNTHSVNGLEALMLAQDNVGISLILYDVLNLGYVTFPDEWNLKNFKFKRCAFHPFSCTYMFLVEFAQEAGQVKTALLPVSLRFVRSSGNQLHLIASKTAQLQILMSYIDQAFFGLDYHWQHAKDLPAKFMANINEELQEKNEPNLVQSLFHLAATGDCPPTLKEWLVDILAERVSWPSETCVRMLSHPRDTSDGTTL